jgi:hypothetical protein
MIIRVFGEDQYEIEEAARPALGELDRRCQDAVEAGDSDTFHACYSEMLALLRETGTPLADDDLRSSDLMLPPADITLAEARSEFSEHGLLPD